MPPISVVKVGGKEERFLPSAAWKSTSPISFPFNLTNLGFASSLRGFLNPFVAIVREKPG